MRPWALITGASAGIGKELARIFAREQFNVVLHARNRERLEAFSEELHRQHAEMETLVLPRDLVDPAAPAELFNAVRHLPVAVLVNNAGFGWYGRFTATELDRHQQLMQVNMAALVELTYLFVRPMLERHDGRIMNVASIAAFQPGPTVNLYYASKAFVHSFSYALGVELKGTGVSVTTLCPGTTRTEFFQRAGIHMRRPYPMMDARAVAEAGYRGLMKGKRVVIPGLVNRIMAAVSACLPSRFTSAVVRRIHEPAPAVSG